MKQTYTTLMLMMMTDAVKQVYEAIYEIYMNIFGLVLISFDNLAKVWLVFTLYCSFLNTFDALLVTYFSLIFLGIKSISILTFSIYCHVPVIWDPPGNHCPIYIMLTLLVCFAGAGRGSSCRGQASKGTVRFTTPFNVCARVCLSSQILLEHDPMFLGGAGPEMNLLAVCFCCDYSMLRCVCISQAPSDDPFDALASSLAPSQPITPPQPVYTGPEVTEVSVCLCVCA